MTGPEHFERAESLLDEVRLGEGADEWTAQLVAAAQVHATLAVAAAVDAVAWQRPPAPGGGR